VRRIVRTIGLDGARWVEAINPTPKSILRVDLHRPGRGTLSFPKVRLTVQISCHHFKGVFAINFRMGCQKMSDLVPQRIVPWIGILRSPKEDQHKGLAFIDHVAVWVLAHELAEVFDFLFEGSLAVDVLVQDVLVDSAEQGNQRESGSKLGPRGISIAGVVANDLVVKTKGGSAVGKVFLDEPLAIEDAAYVVGYFNQCRVHSQVFEPFEMLPDHSRISAVITSSDRLLVARLQHRHGGCGLKRHCKGAKPIFILHDDKVAVLIDYKRTRQGR